jgi:ribulose-phosphate 3-epimerase
MAIFTVQIVITITTMNKQIEIIPAIIPEDFENLKFQLHKVKGICKRVQIDVTDGNYTPNKSWPYEYEDENFESIVAQDEGMPYWEEFDFDIDMMISNPEDEYQKWISAGASSLIFHLESLKGDPTSPEATRDKRLEFIKKVKNESDIKIGIAIQTKTDNKELEPFLDIVDFVQFMGIEKIGYQHQEFDEKVLQKIQDLRFKNQEIDIAVDGSVNLDTVKLLKKAGANMLVSGSAILEAEDIRETIENFLN